MRTPLLSSQETPLHATDWSNDHRLRSTIVSILMALLTILTILSSGAVIIAHNMQKTIQTNKLTYIPQQSVSMNGDTAAMQPIDINAGTAINIMVIGQDTRSGAENAAIGGNDPNAANNHQSDTNMIVHIGADRNHVDIISLPRDSIINAPACNTGYDIIPARNNVMLNSVFPTAYNATHDDGIAASCLVNTVNTLTGLDMQQFILVDFSGLSDMINSIDGVDVCIPQDLHDDNTGLDLKRGLQHLDGVQATQYARIRHGLNTDGSDIMRTVRQQHLVKALMHKLKDDSILSNPTKLYNLANAALSHVKMSSGLADVGVITGLAYSLRGMDMSTSVNAITVPTEPYIADPNRVQWSDNASKIWDALQTDKPVSQAISTDDNSASTSATTNSGSSSDANDSLGNSNNVNTDAGIDNTASNDSSSAGASSVGSSDAGSNDDIDANTGLKTESDGRLIDPSTGGIVNPENGNITDANTGSIIGFADKYVEYTYCKAK